MKARPVYSTLDEQWHICAWCWPGRTVFEQWPEIKFLALPMTHGYCDRCAALAREELEVIQQQENIDNPERIR